MNFSIRRILYFYDLKKKNNVRIHNLKLQFFKKIVCFTLPIVSDDKQ